MRLASRASFSSPLILASVLLLGACDWMPGDFFGSTPIVYSPADPSVAIPDRTGGDVQPLSWGQDASAPDPDWTKPAVGEVTLDAAYGTTVRRLTSAEGTRFDRNTYSRRQAENVDGTMFLTYHGEAEYRVYDRETTELVAVLAIHPGADPQWHATNPGVVRYLAGDNSYIGDLKLYEVDVASGQASIVGDLTERIKAEVPQALYLSDMAEGSPSADGTRYAWIVLDANEDEIALVSYDVASDSILGVYSDLAGLIDQYDQIDWISMAPTGTAVVAGFWDGDIVFNADLTNQRVLNLEAAHSDLVLQADGSDAWVYIDYDDAQSPDAGWLVSIDLESLERTRLFEVYGGATTSIHISGKGYGKPGWVVVSTYNCSDPGAWTCTKVMAVELADEHRVLNLAHTYNCGDDYWTETQGVVNRDFTRVYFNSDGGSCGIDAEVYEVTIPDFQ